MKYSKGLKNIQALQNLKHLRQVYLDSTAIEDISSLAGLSELKILSLQGNKQIASIDDIEHLKLQKLYIAGTSIKINDCAKLQKNGVQIFTNHTNQDLTADNNGNSVLLIVILTIAGVALLLFLFEKLK